VSRTGGPEERENVQRLMKILGIIAIIVERILPCLIVHLLDHLALLKSVIALVTTRERKHLNPSS